MNNSKLRKAGEVFALIFGGLFALVIVGCILAALAGYGMYFVELATR